MSDQLPFHLRFTPPAPTLLGREIQNYDPDSGEVRMRFFARVEFTNRHGSVQGGFVSAMLDSATSVAVLATLPEAETSVTMTLATEFLRPTPTGELFAVARMVERDKKTALSEARLEDAAGTVFAVAKAKLRILKRV